MKQIKAFLLGMKEFRMDMTTHFDEPLIYSYDWGREIMHRLTFRFFDAAWKQTKLFKKGKDDMPF